MIHPPAGEQRNPAIASAGDPHRLDTLEYSRALEIATQLVQPKAIAYLQRHGRSVQVAASGHGYESTIGDCPSEFADIQKPGPTDVVLLGLGTVGFGVYQRLLANPEHFRTIGILVRDPFRHSKVGVARGLDAGVKPPFKEFPMRMTSPREYVLGLAKTAGLKSRS